MATNVYSDTLASTTVSSGQVLTYTASAGPRFLAPTGGSTVPNTPGGATGNIQVNSSTTFYGDDNLTYLASIARVSVGSSLLQGSITLPSTAGNVLALAPSSATANWTLTFPSSPGTANYVLKTDGAGVTSWTSQSGGTVTGQALTSSNDTNVTLTLTGNASVSLLSSVDMVVGWSGTLSSARLNANVVQTVTNDTNVTGVVSSQNLTLGWTGTLAVARGGTGSSFAMALTKTDDTNVTATLTGNASISLISSVNIALGWTGTLSSARLNANVVQTKTDDTNVTATISSQNITLGWTGTLSSARLNANVVQTVTNDTNVTGAISSQNLTLGWTGNLAVSRGGTGSSVGVLPGGSVTLSDAATVALDASLGNLFTLSAAGNRTISAPSNPSTGQKIVIRHFASGAARTLTLSTASSGFRFGTDITGLTVTSASLSDYIGCIYNSSASFWDVVAYSKGY